MRLVATAHAAVRAFGRALATAILPVVAGTLVLAAPVAARTPVDPNTLNPAPPHSFNPTCYEGAAGEPSGIACGGTELLFSQDRSVVGKRFYDADGNLLQRHFREAFEGTLTNPTTGNSVPWTQHDTVLHNLVTPGDFDSGAVQVSGLMTRVWLPTGGTVLIGAGTQVVDLATGAVLKEGGPHPFDRYFADGDASALQPICDALD